MQVPDSTPGAFRQLLRYLYTDELIFSDEHLLDVMLLAQKMVIDRVMNHCLLYTSRNINAANVVQWLLWSNQHNGFEDLRKRAFRYLLANFRAMREANKDALLLLKGHPDLLMEFVMDAI